MKQKTIFLLFVILLCFLIFSCDDGLFYPSLKVVNPPVSGYARAITSVVLVGYEFLNLNITPGNSQTFILKNGMPGGYNNINVTVGYYPYFISNKFNFSNGKTTTITLRQSLGEGSPYYNNPKLE